MANVLQLDRTYTYAGKHYGPGYVEFEEGEDEAYQAISKRHAELLADARKRKLPPPTPSISEEDMYARYRTEEDEENHGPEEDPNPNRRRQSVPAAPYVQQPAPATDGTEALPQEPDAGSAPPETQTGAEGDLMSKSAKELVALAEARGISTEGLRTKTELVAALNA